MKLNTARIRVPAKAARKGVSRYGAVKHAQGRIAVRRRAPQSMASGRAVATSGGALLAAAGTGVALAYLIDPQNGRRRRHVARDRALATMRRGKRDVMRKLDHVSGAAAGTAHDVVNAARREQRPDDLTLTDKVQSTIFRAAEAPKGRVNVNAEGGVIYLRGELDGAKQIRDVVAAANRVEGVRRVVSLLHMPAEPAPMKD